MVVSENLQLIETVNIGVGKIYSMGRFQNNKKEEVWQKRESTAYFITFWYRRL